MSAIQVQYFICVSVKYIIYFLFLTTLLEFVLVYASKLLQVPLKYLKEEVKNVVLPKVQCMLGIIFFLYKIDYLSYLYIF